MIDHIKMITENQDIIQRLLSHPDFESKYYEGRTKKYEFLKEHKQHKGKIKLVFSAVFSGQKIIGYRSVKISIFLHFYFNNYKHNGNDLNSENSIKSIKEILSYLGINDKYYSDFMIINLEVGVNITLETDVKKVIENIKLYKTTDFTIKTDYEAYKISDTTNYKKIKVYAKGLQHQKNPEYKIPINTMRYEIRSNERKYIKKILKVSSLRDLLNPERYKIFANELIKEWDNILILSKTEPITLITPKKNNFLELAKNLGYWNSLPTSEIRVKRKQYHKYTSNIADSHTKLKTKIIEKVSLLLCSDKGGKNKNFNG